MFITEISESALVIPYGAYPVLTETRTSNSVEMAAVTQGIRMKYSRITVFEVVELDPVTDAAKVEMEHLRSPSDEVAAPPGSTQTHMVPDSAIAKDSSLDISRSG